MKKPILAGLLSACALTAAEIPLVGVLPGDPVERLGLQPAELAAPSSAPVHFLGKARYLNHARAAVTHTIDDSTKYITACLDAMDRYDIKATVFVSTEREPISQLWPRLRQAIDNGHEIGSHSRRHQCKWPDTAAFCDQAYSDYEISGSRDDILKNTQQPYVWSWCYPCGNCASLEDIQARLARAGYLIARNYPGEAQDGHIAPGLDTWDAHPYNATYTQVAQKKGGIAKSGRTDVPTLDATFDQIYQRGGIYNLMSHPQWLDYGPDQFYERHLAHISRRSDIWYVPMGPLYAYRTLSEHTQVRAIQRGSAQARFAVFNDLDPKIYNGSLTLEFRARGSLRPWIAGKPLPERAAGPIDRWTGEYFRREGESWYITLRPNTILEFR